MIDFPRTNTAAFELYVAIEKKLTEQEKAALNLHLNTLIGCVIEDVEAIQKRKLENLKEQAARLYKYEPEAQTETESEK